MHDLLMQVALKGVRHPSPLNAAADEWNPHEKAPDGHAAIVTTTPQVAELVRARSAN